MLIEFNRVIDNNEEAMIDARISIDPTKVIAVFGSRDLPNTTIIRLNDGRGGFHLDHPYAEVMERLAPFHQAALRVV